MPEISMPRLSDSMQDGTIVKWLKGDGDTVSAGDELVEIESDKATVVYEVETAGELRISATEGAIVAVGAPIAWIGNPADAPVARSDALPPCPRSTEPLAGPPRLAAPPPLHEVPSRGGAAVVALSSARRLARVLEVDLDTVNGSGRRGQIRRADVELAANARAQHHDSTGATLENLTRAEQAIARRMVEAKTSVPEFHVSTDAGMDAALAMRARISQTAADAPSITDFVVRACALALRAHPRANSSYHADHLELHARINIGIAVDADGLLLVPTILDADEKSLTDIARENKAFQRQARAQELTPDELAHGTFTVSNLGMLGAGAVTPIINPPQAAILGVGAIRRVLNLVDGEPAIEQHMTLTLVCDHRILYGAGAARLLSEIQGLLESPSRLLP